MTYKTLFLSLAAFLVLAGCKEDPLAPARDVAHVRAFAADRADVLAKCDADPGRLKDHPNCVNAQQAEWDLLMQPGRNEVPRLPAKN